jgi:hypothetical protein
MWVQISSGGIIASFFMGCFGVAEWKSETAKPQIWFAP